MHVVNYLVGSIIGAKSATRGPSFPCGFFSQPTAEGRGELESTGAAAFNATDKVPIWLFQGMFGEGGASVSRHLKTRRFDVVPGYSACKYARRLRRGQPGLDGSDDGSRNAII